MKAAATVEQIAVISLGCPKNQVDAETMSGLLVEGGYRITTRLAAADVIIVNTCSFIGKAREESIERILAMAQYKKKGRCRQLLVTGCLAQMHQEDLARELPEVDGFLGTGGVDQILSLLQGERTILLPPDNYSGLAERNRLFSTYPYGYLKIAEGCDHSCSYCVIPKLRGPYRSKDPAQIIAEGKRMAAAGLKEIILVAQDTSLYGRDLPNSSLATLLPALEEIEGVHWLRLLYCYPEHITDELIDLLTASAKICRYLDIPFQHSQPAILRSMGRGVNKPKELIEKLRRRIPGVALRTTLIVGYPGETPDQFQELLDFVRWAEFEQLGAFTYSREKGTRAAALKPQVPEAEKKRRFHALMSLQHKIVLTRNQNLVGQIFCVLVDRIEEGRAYGRCYWQAPDVDNQILFPAAACTPGDFVRVRCTGFDGYDLLGEIDNG